MASEPWYGLWQRHQHLMSRLGEKGYTILYVDPTKIMQGLKEPRLFINRIVDLGGGVTIVRPLFLPLHHRLGPLESFDGVTASLLIKEALRRLGAAEPDIIWLASPYFNFILDGFRNSSIIYDCVDACEGFTSDETTRQWFLNKEAELIKRADRVLTVSRSLLERCLKLNPESYLVPNGVSFLIDPSSIPQDLDRLPTPRIGFVGRLGFWADYDLLLHLAETRPDYTIVLIGPVDSEDDRTRKLDQMLNVHFLGTKEYQDVPAYIKGLDVCMIPFVVQPLTNMANPVKLFEYASFGKPIVSTPLDGVLEFKDLVYASDGSSESFVRMVDKAISEDDAALRERRRKVAMEHDWNYIVENIENILGGIVRDNRTKCVAFLGNSQKERT